MRNNFIDLLRLLASFFVVSFHVGAYPEFSGLLAEGVELFKLTGLWAVPFFFMLAGAFIGTKSDEIIYRQIGRIIRILFYSSILFFPYKLIKTNFEGDELIEEFLSFNILHHGTYFHLWFLSSIVLGLGLFVCTIHHLRRNQAMALAVSIVMANYVFDVLKGIQEAGISTDFTFTRHLISYSFAIFGFYAIRERWFDVSRSRLIAILLVSLLVIYVEPYVLEYYLRSDVGVRAFPLAETSFTIALVLLGLQNNIPNNWFSCWGREHSLTIYLLHPLFAPGIFNALSRLSLSSSLATLVLTFTCSLVVSHYLKRYTPYLFGKLQGN